MRKLNLKVIAFIILGFSTIAMDAQTKSVSITQGDEQLNCIYPFYKGRIDGYYVSYYNNGKKRAEGRLEDGCRAGKWSVWDSTGRLRMERLYENMYVYKTVVPKVTKDTASYRIVRDDDGLLRYFKLREKAVLWSQRIWRNIEKENNEALFDNDRLLKFYISNIVDNNIHAYGSQDDEYKNKLTVEDIQKIDTHKIAVVKFRLKEDAFFDTDRNVYECRIIGICPVGLNKETGKEEDLFWIYYPETRKLLAKEVINKPVPGKIKTLDDLFFYRDFASTIYKKSNMHDWQITDYIKDDGAQKEAERIELSLIENEHDIWIGLTK